jgi:hypothetical protein
MVDRSTRAPPRAKQAPSDMAARSGRQLGSSALARSTSCFAERALPFHPNRGSEPHTFCTRSTDSGGRRRTKRRVYDHAADANTGRFS